MKKLTSSKGPSSSTGLFSFITVRWVTKIIIAIYHGEMKPEDALWDCPESDSSKSASDRLELLWNEEVHKKGIDQASLVRTLLRFDRRSVIVCVLGNFILAASLVAGNCWCVKAILNVIETPHDERSLILSICCVLAFTIATIIQSVSQNAMRVMSDLLGCKLGAGLMAFLYRKVLRLSDVNHDHVGKLLGIFSGDIYRFTRAIAFGQTILSAIIIFPLIVVYLSIEYDDLALTGTAAFVLSSGVLFLATKLLRWYKRKVATCTSNRLFATNELLNKIKFIKTQGCEKFAAESVLNSRKAELDYIFRMRILESFLSLSPGLVLVFLQVVVITVFILTNENASSVTVFNISAVFVCLQTATRLISRGFRFGADISIAVQHIEEILLKPEHRHPDEDTDSTGSQYAAVFSHAKFSFEDEPADNEDIKVDLKSKLLEDSKKTDYNTLIHYDDSKSFSFWKGISTALPNINCSIKKGSLVGVCGTIGTGKTLFLKTLLGRMHLSSGSYRVNERIAYLPQTPWVINATLKDNILFGYPFDVNRYRYVLDVCCLWKDLNILPGGENTEIGERGVNLSGGQKQRISLARAVYSDREMYLLDDPFSAVDNYVADRLFRRCIQEALKDKTVVLVTHRIKLMSECDSVVFVKPGGEIVKSDHNNLRWNEDQYRQLLKAEKSENKTDNKDDHKEKSIDLSESEKWDELERSIGKGRLITDEVQETSAVGWSTVKSYIKAGDGFWRIPLYLSLIFAFSCVQIFASFWLRYWFLHDSECKRNMTIAGLFCNDSNINRQQYLDRDSPDFYLNLGVYVGTFEVLVIVAGLSSSVLAFMTFQVSKSIHINFLERVLACPMSFFDVTPVGRLLNLFSSDLTAIDVGIGYDFDYMTINLMLLLCILAMIIYITPWMGVVLLPCLLVVYYCASRTNVPIQSANKMEKSGRSMPYSLLTSTISGIECIVAFDKTQQFIKRFCESLDGFYVRTILPAAFVRWTAYRLDIISILTAFTLSIVLIFVDTNCSVADAGLALTLVIQMSFIISNQPHHIKEVFGHFASADRMVQASKVIPVETSTIVPSYTPNKEWPERGEILIKDLWFRYQPHLPYILKGVNCHVQPKQKIGVVGRTGAGKSSLMAAMFRLWKPSGGGIFVDGVDISTVPLMELRSKLTMISQDPILLSDTLRSNLVNNQETTDAEIWEALEKCHLSKRVALFPGKLDEMLTAGGTLSVGEKQLLCMARALLHGSKVMLLDEATASMDPQTDSLLQQTIRSCFSDCTMIIIAHRLNTVLDCDKILVMEDGKCVEFDTPAVLLADPKSKLSLMKQSRKG